MPYPKVPRRLPTILTVEEVTRLIDAARTLSDRTMLMVLLAGNRPFGLDLDHACGRRWAHLVGAPDGRTPISSPQTWG